jgi:hypothetical protein
MTKLLVAFRNFASAPKKYLNIMLFQNIIFDFIVRQKKNLMYDKVLKLHS